MKSKHDAILGFCLSFGVLIPLFNYILVPTAFVLCLMSIRRIKRLPKKFTGMKFAVAGLIISTTGLILLISDIFLRIIM